MEEQDKAKWRYEVYKRRGQKGYPPDLIWLLCLFNGKSSPGGPIILPSGDRLPLLPILKSPSRQQLVEKEQALRKVRNKWDHMKERWKTHKVPEPVREQEAAKVRKELGIIEGKYAGAVHEEALGQFKKEVSLMEQTFKDFFFNRQIITQLEAKVGDGIPSEAQKAAYARATKVVGDCINLNPA